MICCASPLEVVCERAVARAVFRNRNPNWCWSRPEAAGFELGTWQSPVERNIGCFGWPDILSVPVIRSGSVSFFIIGCRKRRRNITGVSVPPEMVFQIAVYGIVPTTFAVKGKRHRRGSLASSTRAVDTLIALQPDDGH